MKKTLIISLLLASLHLNAQVLFEGKGETVDVLNTPNGQNYLVFNPHHKTIALTEEQAGKSTPQDLYRTQERIIDNDSWQVFTFSDWLGEKGVISPLGFTSEGLYYSQVVFDKGVYIGKVRRISQGKDQEVKIPFFKNKAPIQSGCISQDGQYMILSLEANNTSGVEDLYVVKKQADGSWDRAKNLGAQLNTEYQEVTPFLAEDNRTLFFSTNGRGGQGSFDLFYTIRQDDSWRNWSEPVNLGAQINTSGSETSFSFLDGEEWAYYVSAQDSDGYGDVMRIKFKEEIEADTTQQVAAKVEISPTAIVLKIVDVKSRKMLPATMIVGTDVRMAVNGLFEIDSLTRGEVELKSLGYLPKIIMLDEQLKVGENVVALSAVSKGSVMTLDHVLFRRSTAQMIAGAEKELNLVVEVLNENPNIKILLKGHTDNTGDTTKNIRLSEARVKSVISYLISQGIDTLRVKGKGYGGTQPIASNETEETRKLNRRVEFEIVDD